MSPEETRFAASVAAGICAAGLALICDWLRVSHWVSLRTNRRLHAELAALRMGIERLAEQQRRLELLSRTRPLKRPLRGQRVLNGLEQGLH
jgi:hypothetical protein